MDTGQRNLTIFPNLQIIDISSAQLRTWRPLSPDKTEMTSHCLAPVGESAAARRFRIRAYEDFFNRADWQRPTTTSCTSSARTGYAAQAAARLDICEVWNPRAQTVIMRANWASLRWSPPSANTAFGGETNFHSGYREWRG